MEIVRDVASHRVTPQDLKTQWMKWMLKLINIELADAATAEKTYMMPTATTKRKRSHPRLSISQRKTFIYKDLKSYATATAGISSSNAIPMLAQNVF
uniref:Uncharacterized protein n=1 Tax=Romanomermis culicivorax TaxID=13658 RepID=A0A915HTP0_ROMCU